MLAIAMSVRMYSNMPEIRVRPIIGLANILTDTDISVSENAISISVICYMDTGYIGIG